MAKTVSEQIKNLSEGESLPPILLILTKDKIRAERVVSSILKKEKSERLKISGDNFSTAKVLQTFSAPSLFSPKTTVIVTKAEEIKAEALNDLLNTSTELTGKGTVIFCASSMPERSIFLRTLRERECAIELPELKGPTLRRWVEAELKQQGITKSEPQAIELLIQIANESADELTPLIEHISLSLDSNTLSKQHILNIFSYSFGVNEYELIDLISRKNLSKALRDISLILQSGKNQFLMLGLLNKTFSQYTAIKSEQSHKRTPYEIRAGLGVPPWLYNKLSTAVDNYTLPALYSGLRNLLATDSLLKNRSLGAELNFSSLIMKLTKDERA